MKKPNFLKNLPTLLSSVALVAAVSCTPLPPVPYNPPGARPPIVGNDGRSFPSNQSTRDYRQSPSNTRSQSYTPPRSQTYTPPSKRPSYQPPAPRTTTPSTTPSQPSRTSSGKYPLATPSIKPNTVISPYAPYNVLDTTGASSGDKLCDPSTIPINPATGKQYVNPATGQPDVKRGKYFIVP